MIVNPILIMYNIGSSRKWNVSWVCEINFLNHRWISTVMLIVIVLCFSTLFYSVATYVRRTRSLKKCFLEFHRSQQFLSLIPFLLTGRSWHKQATMFLFKSFFYFFNVIVNDDITTNFVNWRYKMHGIFGQLSVTANTQKMVVYKRQF